MTVRDIIISAVKTAVQVAVAALFAWAVPVLDWMTSAGITVDRSAVEAAAFAIVTGLVTAALNWAGRRWPIVNVILSFGLARSGPTY